MTRNLPQPTLTKSTPSFLTPQDTFQCSRPPTHVNNSSFAEYRLPFRSSPPLLRGPFVSESARATFDGTAGRLREDGTRRVPDTFLGLAQKVGLKTCGDMIYIGTLYVGRVGWRWETCDLGAWGGKGRETMCEGGEGAKYGVRSTK
jgi:hypothetical protein